MVLLPDLPSDVRGCFQRLVKAPPAGTMTSAAAIKLIAALKRSEVEKAKCGRRAVAFYDQVKARYGTQ